MDSINFVSVAKALLDIVRTQFEDKEETPVDEHYQIADILLEKLQEITFKYLFVDEAENEEGGTVEKVDYVNTGESNCNEMRVSDEVPFTYKQKVVEQRALNRSWSFTTLQKRFPKLKHRSYVKKWEAQVKMGGTGLEILLDIEKYVISRFKESRSEYLPVHHFDFRRWGLEKAFQYPGFPFKASSQWIHCLKRRNGIVSRKVQKVVSFRAIREQDLIMDIVREFREEMLPLIAQYDPKNVFNTDQTGFRYEMLSTRTLSNKGERYTFGAAYSPNNKATHSYTVQYIISLDGSIVGDAFICLQEQNGTLGPTVESNIIATPNLTVVCSKSGKLTKKLVEEFSDTVVKPQARGKVLYIADHWGGQTDENLYNSRFKTDDVDMTVKFIPENCTDHCQPLDTYFHRQLKFLVKTIYDYAILHEKQHDTVLTTRNGVLKVQSLVHFILSAPCFKAMIQYCWYSSGLKQGEKPVFENVKSICFDLGHMQCDSLDCARNAFIKCSWCKTNVCFEEFFHQYHLMICTHSPWC